MIQENKIQSEYDEIDLMDYVLVLLKRKWFILIIFLIAIISAGIFSYLSPKIYKIETSLEIGRVGGTIIESPLQIKEKINGDIYGTLVREKLGTSKDIYPKIESENQKDTSLIKISIESSDAQKAKNILEEINNLILAVHQETTDTQKELIEKNIKTTESQIQLVESNIDKTKNKIKLTESDIEKTKNKIKPLESDIERIENKIKYAEEEKKNLEAKVDALQKVLPYQQDPGTQFALFDTKEKLANKKQEIEDLYLRINSLNISIEDLNLTINSLEKTKEDYNSQINSLKSNIENLNAQINSLRVSLDDIKATQVVKSPIISKFPIKPNSLLNVAIAGVLGIFAGVFLAFGKEWWQQNKKR